MDTNRHKSRTTLVVESNIDAAMELQDRIVRSGNCVLTAYSLDRAKLLANSAMLDDAVIDFEFDRANEIVAALRSRRIPFVLHAVRAADITHWDQVHSASAALCASAGRTSTCHQHGTQALVEQLSAGS